MTSVDSGVETGNDSNDSSVTHENNVAAATGSNVTMNYANPYSSSEVGPSKSLAVSIASICQGSTNSDESQSTSIPSTSGPLVLHVNAEPTKVLEFRIPPAYLDSIYGTSTMELLRTKSAFHSEMMRTGRRRKYNIKVWQNYQGSLDERKMRLAAATNNVDMMRRLLSKGVCPNNKDDRGRSPLHLAAARGYTEIVHLLLEHGANPDQRDCLGNTPLHLAAVTSKIAVVTLLLKAGTNVLSSDERGRNPLQLAQTKLRLLQSCKGSDMNKIKDEVQNVVSMLLAYLQRGRDASEQVEALSTFCSRLSLSSTSDQIQEDVRDLLANIDSLSLAS